MRILDALVRTSQQPQVDEERSWGFDPYMWSRPWATFDGSQPQQTDSSFYSLVESIHRKNGIVAAAVAARAALVSQVRFRWRRGYTQNKQGELWGDRSLSILERPGTSTRAELLSRLEHDVSYAGNAYVVRDGNKLRRLAPDRVSFVMRADSLADWDGSDNITTVPFDAEVVGLAYHAQRHGEVTQTFAVGEFAHWAPEPDPVNWWRGESWVTAVVREVLTDGQSVDHVGKFFENASTPNLVFKFPEYRTPEEVKAFAELTNRKHAGTDNAYRNMFLAGGADVQVVGSTLESLSLKDLVGGFETRIAARARIPGVILGIREGYAGSSLNAGNYQSARRMWADGWFSPTVESLCAALEAIVPAPGGSELHYDPKAVLFLQEDQQDAAQILQTQAVTMRQLVEAGYDPSTVTEAVTTGDMAKLNHTGNVSVQLQPPGTTDAAGNPIVNEDGKTRARELAEIVQKIYLGVGVVLTADEARKIVNDAGGSLPPGFDPGDGERGIDVALLEERLRGVVADRPAPAFTVNVPERETHVHVPELRMEPTVVNVSPTPVTIENVVEPTPVTVENNVENRVDVAPAKVPPAQVTVMPAESEPSTFKVKRDRDGRISEVAED